MRKYVLCVTTLIALATAVPALAAPALMDFGVIATGGVPSYTSGSTLDLSTAFNLGAGPFQVLNPLAGDTTGATNGLALSISPTSFTYGSGTLVSVALSSNVVKTFTTVGGLHPGLYTETLTSVIVTGRAANSISLELLGTLTGPALSGFSSTPAGFLLTANQSGGLTGCNGGPCAVTWSATEQSNPPPVGGTPLPAALPLFASGLGALGLLGWRRKRKNAAAIAA